MAYTLYTGQILEALRTIKHPDADMFVKTLHVLTDQAASALAIALGISRGELSTLWDSNAAVSFMPAYDEQPLPEAIQNMDSEQEWYITD